MEIDTLQIDEETSDERLGYYLSQSPQATQKFNEGDRFGTIFALIESGLTQSEYEEFLVINPHGWYDRNTINVLKETILHQGYKNSPIMLHRDPEAIVERRLLHQKFLAALTESSNSTSDNSV